MALENDTQAPDFMDRYARLVVDYRLVVEAIWSKVAGIVGRSFEIRLPSPVRPGDTLTGQSEIQKITLRPERRDAVVIFKTELVNEEQRPVLVLVLDALIHMRPAERTRT